MVLYANSQQPHHNSNVKLKATEGFLGSFNLMNFSDSRFVVRLLFAMSVGDLYLWRWNEGISNCDLSRKLFCGGCFWSVGMYICL